MKLRFIWNQEKDVTEVDVISHPHNQERLQKIEAILETHPSLTVKDPKNDRQSLLPLEQIEAISALGHMSKVLTANRQTYFLNKRLKDLKWLENEHFFRINNAVILNLAQVHSFVAGTYARLEVETMSQNSYTVSRHYAKYIKERFK
ncbi:LytTR family DNA-binding domain-containing protein [Bacillus pumilus]|uniref:LytTR family DNA-binding domain-containing protein n=1 Tax=Bacillus pumilus TaxID=1408 RepID=UPI0011E8D932|nr:LytTR family DNA-binding domain-containing protein [Bacillus pumilus]TYS29399.1 LytTR family transcriptional regulator [Bacillus pumilus]TYS42367.1 LytTR family transcriptional regulator [Bacillus pumilus]